MSIGPPPPKRWKRLVAVTPPCHDRISTPVTKNVLVSDMSIKLFEGKAFRLENVCLCDALSTVKAMIDAKVGIPPDGQRLIYAGKRLGDSQSLSRHGIRDGSTLLLTLAEDQWSIRDCL